MKEDLPAVLEALSTAHGELLKGLKLPSTGGELGVERAEAEPEPVYPAKVRDDIQGNVIPGFNKDHQHFLFLRFRAVKGTKAWLRWLAPQIASMDEVLAFVRAHRALRLKLGVKEPGLKATWINVAFSAGAIAKLAGKEEAAAFGERSFLQGLAERSTYLGDPTDPRHPGYRGKWVVGGPKNTADILVIVGSDDPADLDATVETIKAEAARCGLDVLFEQRGQTLPEPLRGHEHFGFKDGISQPGVRGKVSSAPGDFITPRYVDASDPHADIFAKPGQVLVWPGQFLLGERRQNTESLTASAPGATDFPKWARRGSYLVCRRLRQDVPAFWEFVRALAAETGGSMTHVAAMLVGRWPSGAPLMRATSSDDPALAGDEFANNHFIFDDDTRASSLRPIPGYPGDSHSPAQADILGAVCPHFAHIRKVNPRDSGTDLGKVADGFLRMILRRGIPFGPPMIGIKKPPPKLVKQERGLMFLSYAATIESQFEFLTRRWSNSPVQPNFGGHDPVVGQEGRGDRVRFVDFPTERGPVRLTLKKEWVTVTGGGYFFAPPISAIAGVLGA
ncbi:MAG: Dyp-type peroxidase [Actinomycetota bacterium]|nr:Dyp-type peroxidase [Actinomycetota bacterium]